jgi:hypothetical protein
VMAYTRKVGWVGTRGSLFSGISCIKLPLLFFPF